MELFSNSSPELFNTGNINNRQNTERVPGTELKNKNRDKDNFLTS